MRLGYLAVDQFGQTIRLTKPKHPLKQLREKLGRTWPRKMYVDGKDGEAKHIGYIFGNQWFDVYEVHEWEGRV